VNTRVNERRGAVRFRSAGLFGVSVLCVCWSVGLAEQFARWIRSVSWVFDSEELPLVGTPCLGHVPA
jgi:hypothetical protein